MIKQFSLFSLILTLLCFSSLFSQDKHFLWKVEGLSNTVYLLGSVHVAKPDFYPLPQVIEAAFSNAENLVVEVDVQKANLAIQAAVLLKGMYAANDNLSNHLSADLYAKLEVESEKLGMNVNALSKFKPWLVAATLTTLRMQKSGYKGGEGMEFYFLKLARRQKNIYELETALFQVDLLANMPEELQILNLEEALNVQNDELQIVEKIFDAWKTGDALAMEKIVFKGYNQKTKELYKKLYDDRNKKMAKKIEGYLKSGGNYFVLAGSGHFVGERGIINLLRKKGYKVEQM